MPWCPNCKTEYREGITHCADCKVELVAEYKDAVLKNATAVLVQVDTEHRMFAQKLHDFLEYSKISSVILEEEGMLGVYVTPENLYQAKKCFKAFYSVETEMMMQQAAEAAFLKGEEFDYFGEDDDEEDVEDTAESSAPVYETVEVHTDKKKCCTSENKNNYVSAASKYDDYRSSGFTFVILGGLGVGFALLNFMGVFTLFGSTFSSTVLLIMFGVFLGLGIFSFAKAEKLKESAVLEQQIVSEAKAWMEKNFTKEMLADLNVEENVSDEVNTEELLYMDRLDSLVGRLLKAFPNLHDSLAEQLVEEFISQYEE